MMTSQSYTEVPDEALAALVAQDPDGPEAGSAAAELLGRYSKITYRWCLRMVGDREGALDLAQEALLNAYRHLGSYRGTGRFVSWMYVITRNCCLCALRRPSLLRDDEADPDERAGDHPGPDQALEEKDDEEALLALIRTHLDPREQEALWLRCFEQMPVDAITRLLRIDDASGARGLLQGARRKLRRALERRDAGNGGK
jgi:RNA polymerase sigma-70 factor (ECF subfamily)